jgi:hypothetical protein
VAVRGVARGELAALAMALLLVPAPGAGRAATVPTGQIVYVGLTGNLYLVRPDGTDRRALTSDGSRTTPFHRAASLRAHVGGAGL